jgi:hypothetical protein
MFSFINNDLKHHNSQHNYGVTRKDWSERNGSISNLKYLQPHLVLNSSNWNAIVDNCPKQGTTSSKELEVEYF